MGRRISTPARAGDTSARYSDWSLHRFGLGLGVRLARVDRRAARELLLLPVEYVRCAETRYVLRHLDVRPGHRVLDVGSPKLLSLFLAARLGNDVHATDLVDDFVDGSELHARVALGEERAGYVVRCEDARRLSYPAEAFDRVFSISTIEHIPADGDTVAVQEIARVLAPGGLAAFTVPWLDGGYLEEFKERGDPDAYWTRDDEGPTVFYQRAYDRESLERRLLRPSGLTLVDLSFWGERRFRVERVILDRRLPVSLRRSLYPAHFLLARAFLRPLREDEPSRKKVACFTLRKEPA